MKSLRWLVSSPLVTLWIRHTLGSDVAPRAIGDTGPAKRVTHGAFSKDAASGPLLRGKTRGNKWSFHVGNLVGKNGLGFSGIYGKDRSLNGIFMETNMVIRHDFLGE